MAEDVKRSRKLAAAWGWQALVTGGKQNRHSACKVSSKSQQSPGTHRDSIQLVFNGIRPTYPCDLGPPLSPPMSLADPFSQTDPEGLLQRGPNETGGGGQRVFQRILREREKGRAQQAIQAPSNQANGSESGQRHGAGAKGQLAVGSSNKREGTPQAGDAKGACVGVPWR